jgi:signal transduction histidine kinase
VDGVARLRALIQDLLRFSRAGQNITLSSTHLAPIVARAISHLSEVLKGATVELSEDMPPVLADEAVLRQAIHNVLSNSVKFRRKDVPLTIKVSATLTDGFVRVEIADNGLGIAPEHQHAVFEVFKRLYSTEEYPGTGIGLALVRRIIHAHGGEVGVRSAGANQGTTVWFTLRHRGEKAGSAPR